MQHFRARADVGNHQHRDEIGIEARDHHILSHRRQDADELRAQRADADPRAAGKLEVLADPAIEIQTASGPADR